MADIDGDSADECIRYTNSDQEKSSGPSNFVVLNWSQEQVIKDQENIAGQFIGLACFDVSGTSVKEVVSFELAKNQIYLNIYNLEEYNPICIRHWQITDIPIPQALAFTSFKIMPVAIYDWNEDGSKDLICIVLTSYGYQPRGIWIFDLKTGKCLLKKQVGPLVSVLTLFDIDQDSKNEIIFGSRAPFNCEKHAGAQRYFNETDDSRSWLFIIDDDGSFKVKFLAGEYGSAICPFIKNMNREGIPEVILLVHAGPTKKGGSVHFFDINSNQLIHSDYKNEDLVLSSAFFDWQEENNTDEFLTLWQNGLLEIRDINNEVVASKATGFEGSNNFLVDDLENNNKKEIIISGDAGLLLLDNKLKPVLFDSLKVDRLALISPGSGKKKLLQILSSGKLTTYEIEKTLPYYWHTPPIAVITFFFGFGIAFALLVILGFWHKKENFVLTKKLSPSTLFFILDSSGSIKWQDDKAVERFGLTQKKRHFKEVFGSEQWANVRRLIEKNILQKTTIQNEEIIISKEIISQYFLVNLFPRVKNSLYRREWILTLQDTTELVQSKRAMAWAGMAQRLAHEIKTPLSSMMLAAQQLQIRLKSEMKLDDQWNKYLDYIITQVYRLRGTTDAFMKFAHLERPNLQPIKLNALVEDCLKEIAEIVSSNIEIRQDLAADLPSLSADVDQMAIVVKNVLENAVNAMKDQGVLTVATRLVQSLQANIGSENGIVLEISDTGCGIPKAQLDQIFEPFFSRRAGGTGLGLTLVKKIVSDHRGEIQVKSEPGIGTSVFITLPVKQGEQNRG